MSAATKPIILDETGQRIADAIEALYIGKRVLININNVGWGTVTGGGAYPSGQTVTLTATPSTGCGFLAWKDSNGNILSTESTYTFVVLADTIIQAIFIDDTVTEIVPWSTGNIEKIAGMIGAAYAGIIDLTDYWSVGDTRTVSVGAIPKERDVAGEEYTIGANIPAENVDFVIMDFECTGFKLESDSTKAPKMIVGMKKAFNVDIVRDIGSGENAGWSAMSARNMCDYGFRDALPSLFLSLFKRFKWSHWEKINDGSGLVEVTDLFGYVPAKCAFGINTRVYASEKALYNQWEWFATAENRLVIPSVPGVALCSSRITGYWLDFHENSTEEGQITVQYEWAGHPSALIFGCI